MRPASARSAAISARCPDTGRMSVPDCFRPVPGTLRVVHRPIIPVNKQAHVPALEPHRGTVPCGSTSRRGGFWGSNRSEVMIDAHRSADLRIGIAVGKHTGAPVSVSALRWICARERRSPGGYERRAWDDGKPPSPRPMRRSALPSFPLSPFGADLWPAGWRSWDCDWSGWWGAIRVGAGCSTAPKPAG